MWVVFNEIVVYFGRKFTKNPRKNTRGAYLVEDFENFYVENTKEFK